MRDWFSIICLLAVAHAVGAIPFGYLAGRFVRGIDIREHGSGNIGATNAGRVLGKKWGILVLVLDFLKGALPVAILPNLLFPDDHHLEEWRVAAAVATITGHMFPFWLQFRGGKGVATALGAVVILAPFSMAVSAALFVLVVGVTRWVSLGSIIGSLGFGVCETIRQLNGPDPNLAVILFGLLMSSLIVWRHRLNLVRIWRGTEPRFSFRRGQPDLGTSQPEQQPVKPSTVDQETSV